MSESVVLMSYLASAWPFLWEVLSCPRSEAFTRSTKQRYSPARARANGLTRAMETREGNPARFPAERGTRNARIQRDRALSCAGAISRSVMKIPGCIDMHLQDSDCARRAPGVHFARFQDFPAESRKSEFFTIARTHHQCHPATIAAATTTTLSLL